jgi:hypothetical protein
MKLLTMLLLLLSLFFVSCEKQIPDSEEPQSLNSFLPMQIGNYWRYNSENYTEIQDTLTMENKLYYKFFSRIGGDVVSTRYMRLDENNQLWESYPSDPGRVYLHAKFDAAVNDTFFTLNDQTWNDYKVRLIEKTATKRTFEFDMVYHPNLKGHPHTNSYIKGKGFAGPWQRIQINGVFY